MSTRLFSSFSLLLFLCALPLCEAIQTRLQAQAQTYRLVDATDIGERKERAVHNFFYPTACSFDEKSRRLYVASSFHPYIQTLESEDSLGNFRAYNRIALPLPQEGFSGRIDLIPNRQTGALYAVLKPQNIRASDSSEKAIYRIAPSGAVESSFFYKNAVADIAVYEGKNRIFVADGSLIRILDAVSLTQLDTLAVSFPIGFLALDSLGDKLYILGKAPVKGKLSFTIRGLSPPFASARSYLLPSVESPIGAFIDTVWNRFLIALPSQLRIVHLGENALARAINLHGSYSRAWYSPANERFYALNPTGYAAHGQQGNFGKLLALSLVDDSRDSARVGLQSADIVLDEKRERIGVVAEQESTLRWYDWTTLKENGCIELARRFDDMELSPDGQYLYISEYLGAHGRLWAYNLANHTKTLIDSTARLCDLVADSARGRVFGLAHQENAIYIISTFTNAVIGKSPLWGLREQRGDALSAMCMNKSRQFVYVALPEHKIIAVQDIAASSMMKPLKFFPQAELPKKKGAGSVQIAVAPELDKLYALHLRERRLSVYNLKNSTPAESFNLANKWLPAMTLWQEDLLAYDATSKHLFIGPLEFDCVNNRFTGKILSGAARFVGYNAKGSILYAIGQVGATVFVQEHDPETLALKAVRNLHLNPEPTAPPLVSLDARKGHLHILHRHSGLLFRYDVKALVGTEIAAKEPEMVTLAIFPNPVNNQATIRFGVQRRERVHLAVYDHAGKEIIVLTDEEYDAGTHTIILKVQTAALTTQSYTLRLKSPSMSYSQDFQVQR